MHEEWTLDRQQWTISVAIPDRNVNLWTPGTIVHRPPHA